MTQDEARKMLERGYYGNTMETEEVFGFICKYFPEIDRDQELESMVFEVLYGSR